VRRAYLAALRADTVLTVAKATQEARQLVVDQISELVKASLKSSLDLSFAQTGLSEARLLISSAEKPLALSEFQSEALARRHVQPCNHYVAGDAVLEVGHPSAEGSRTQDSLSLTGLVEPAVKKWQPDNQSGGSKIRGNLRHSSRHITCGARKSKGGITQCESRVTVSSSVSCGSSRETVRSDLRFRITAPADYTRVLTASAKRRAHRC